MRKRTCALLLLACFLLSGCSIFGERTKEPVTFYYVRRDFQYFTQNDVIVPEVREASGHREDISYLLALYVMGPNAEELRSPLPRGSVVHSFERTPEGITLHLTSLDLSLSDSEFSLACACLSMTCIELTDAQSVTIHSGERTLTMDRASLALADNSANVKEES